MEQLVSQHALAEGLFVGRSSMKCRAVRAHVERHHQELKFAVLPDHLARRAHLFQDQRRVHAGEVTLRVFHNSNGVVLRCLVAFTMLDGHVVRCGGRGDPVDHLDGTGDLAELVKCIARDCRYLVCRGEPSTEPFVVPQILLQPHVE